MCARPLLIVLAAALVPAFAGAQTASPQQGQSAPSAQPPGLTVAPDAPKQQPEAVRSSASGQQQVQSTGKPADLCQELVAYLQQAAQQPAGAAQGQTAGASGQPPAPQSAQPQNAGAPNTPSSAGQPAAPGQTAPAVDRPQQSSGVSAPTPSAPQAPAPNVTTSEAQAWLSAKDLRACQQAAQKMRRAGVALPPGILALAALREDLLAGTGQAPPPR